MNVLAVISPGLKVLFERVGKPEIINRPDFLRFGGTGAVIACNHVGWTDSLWMAYAVYPRQLRYLSKQELFGPTLSRWVLEHGGSIPITALTRRQVRSRPPSTFCGTADSS
jgi:1-acyl-sn-glycerol-3-phosphate acyltransferase